MLAGLGLATSAQANLPSAGQRAGESPGSGLTGGVGIGTLAGTPPAPRAGSAPSAAPAAPAPPALAGTAAPAVSAPDPTVSGSPSPAANKELGRELPALIRASEKQLVAIENTLISLREEMSRLRQLARHPCDEPSTPRAQLFAHVRRDVSSRGLSRIELDTPSVPGGGLAQLRLPLAVENGRELCVLGYWEVGRSLGQITAGVEGETAACLSQPAQCPELDQYGNAEDARDDGKTPRTRLRIRVPAHEPWQRAALSSLPGSPHVPLLRRLFSSPALLNVAVYERRGDDWRLLSAGRLDAPIRGRFTSGLLVLALVAIFYVLLARAVKRGGSDGSVPLETQVLSAPKTKR
jgi:hypothetical protein